MSCVWTEGFRSPQMHGSDCLGACKRVIEFADDSYDPLCGFRGKVAVGTKVLSDDIRGSRHLLLGFKELSDISPTPFDEPLEFWEVGDVTLLYAR